MSLRTLFAKVTGHKPEPTLDSAEKALAAGRKSDAAVKFRALAEAGSAAAQVRLAKLYENGEGVLQNFVEAAKWYTKAAEQGSAAAQGRLGEIYLTGLAAPPDLATPTALARLEESPQESLLRRLYPEGLRIAQDPELAARWNLRAAQAGDAAAQARLGYQYATGLGVAVDLDAAEHWFATAAPHNAAAQLGLGMLNVGVYGERRDHARALQCLAPCAANGNATAQYCLAMLLLFGDVEHDAARAVTLLEQAAVDRPAAMFYLGECYRAGLGVAPDSSQAETWLRRAATRGHSKALLSLVRLFRSGTDPDLNTAAVLCRQAAELGDAEAQYLLGQFSLSGEGVPRDATEAARWLGRAAAQNFAPACERLGALYAEGAGLPQDFLAAADWFQRAAVEGDANALYHLSTLRLRGLGVTRDPSAALEGYREAAQRGSVAACVQLGTQYATGEHVARNHVTAARWYAEAAQKGDPTGRYNLAFLHFRGLGVPQDAVRAVTLLEQAAAAGSTDAAWALHRQFDTGEYVPANTQKATEWLMRAAELGSAAAACALVDALAAENSGTPAAERVVNLVEACAVRGDPVAQARLGLLYLEGVQRVNDPEMALCWFTRAAQGGNAFAQAWMGDALVRGGQGVDVDRDAALAWYEKAALQGHAGAIAAITSLHESQGAGGD